jgi:hypothetical protein
LERGGLERIWDELVFSKEGKDNGTKQRKRRRNGKKERKK